MTSMTGYAYTEKSFDDSVVSVEIRAVNSRFLELTLNLPSFLNKSESYFRRRVSDSVVRGKIDVNIHVKELESTLNVVPDTVAAKSYLEAIKKIAFSCGYDSTSIPLSLVISQAGVLNIEKSYDSERLMSMIEPVFEETLEKFIDDRKREGENLKKDIKEKLSALSSCAVFFKEWQPKMESLFKAQLEGKFKELLGDSIDENRILTELSAMLVKYTINEEIVRLQSHIDAMENELSLNPTPGKRLDFICQEMNREINTIGSKNQFSEVGKVVIDEKDALENIREQSRNVE